MLTMLTLSSSKCDRPFRRVCAYQILATALLIMMGTGIVAPSTPPPLAQGNYQEVVVEANDGQCTVSPSEIQAGHVEFVVRSNSEAPVQIRVVPQGASPETESLGGVGPVTGRALAMASLSMIMHLQSDTTYDVVCAFGTLGEEQRALLTTGSAIETLSPAPSNDLTVDNSIVYAPKTIGPEVQIWRLENQGDDVQDLGIFQWLSEQEIDDLQVTALSELDAGHPDLTESIVALGRDELIDRGRQGPILGGVGMPIGPSDGERGPWIVLSLPPGFYIVRDPLNPAALNPDYVLVCPDPLENGQCVVWNRFAALLEALEESDLGLP